MASAERLALGPTSISGKRGNFNMMLAPSVGLIIPCLLAACVYILYIDLGADHSASRLSSRRLILYAGLATVSAAYRIYNSESYFHVFALHASVSLLLIPDFVQACLSADTAQKLMPDESSAVFKASRKQVKVLFALTTLMPEYGILYCVVSRIVKRMIIFFSPPGFSDTDQRMHPSLIQVYFSILVFSNFHEFIAAALLPSLLGVVAAFYTITGIEKIKYNWVYRNKGFFLKKSAEFQLSWNKIPDALSKVILFFSPFVFFIELFAAPLLAPFNGVSFLVLVLSAYLVFHFTVLVSSGINFWKWKMSLLSLMFLMVSYGDYLPGDSRLHTIVYGISFIYTYFISNKCIGLGWLDSPIAKFIKIEAKLDDSDEWIQINPKWFYPYDVIFSQNRFNYFFPKTKFLVGCLGAVRDNGVYDVLVRASESGKSEEEVAAIVNSVINQVGVVNQKTSNAAAILHFVKASLEGREYTRWSMLRYYLSTCFIHIRNNYQTCPLNQFDGRKVASFRITSNRVFWSVHHGKFLDISQEQAIFNVAQ